MPIKDMARILTRSGKHLPPRRMLDRVPDRPDRKERQKQAPDPIKKPPRGDSVLHTVPEGEKGNPQSVYSIPDSWTAPRQKTEEPVPEILVEKKRSGPPLKPRHKRRKNSVSVSVSEEEEFYLRQYASQKGLGFSEWVRATLFKAMGRKIPDRPTSDGVSREKS